MKKRIVLLISLIVLAIFTGCSEKILAPEENIPTQKSSGQILMKISSSGEAISSTEAIITLPSGKPIVFEAAAADGSSGWTYKWLFADDGSTVTGKYAIHTYKLNPPSETTIKLTGTNSSNQSYDTTFAIRIAWATDGKDLIKVVGTGMRNDGLCADTIAISKDRLKHLPGSKYFIKGDVTSGNWTTRVDIAASDTNFSFENGRFITLPSSQTGRYVRVIINTQPGKHQFAFGKVVNGVEVWEDFTGSSYVDPKINPGLINMVITNNGGISLSQITLPGLIGDTGENWVTSLTPETEKLNIFFNLFRPYADIKPFVTLIDSNGSVVKVLAQSPTPGYPNSGMLSVNYSDLPNKFTVTLKFGENINFPLQFSEYMKYSIFYDPYYGEISFVVQKVLAKSSTGGVQWVIKPAPRRH